MKANYKFGLKDYITGDRIIGWAGRIFAKNQINKKGVVLKTLDFSLGAKCVVLEPMTINKPLMIKDSAPQGLIGKKIYGEAEDYSRFEKVKITAGHTHLQTVLKHNVFCMINMPISSRQSQL